MYFLCYYRLLSCIWWLQNELIHRCIKKFVKDQFQQVKHRALNQILILQLNKDLKDIPKLLIFQKLEVHWDELADIYLSLNN